MDVIASVESLTQLNENANSAEYVFVDHEEILKKCERWSILRRDMYLGCKIAIVELINLAMLESCSSLCLYQSNSQNFATTNLSVVVVLPKGLWVHQTNLS